MSGDSWADLLYYLDQAACRGAGETADSAKGRAIFLRAARESAAAAIAAEREAMASACEEEARRVREEEFFGPREGAEVLRGLAERFRARGEARR